MDFKYVKDQVHEQNHRKMSKTDTNSKLYVFLTILKKIKKNFMKILNRNIFGCYRIFDSVM